MKARLAKDPKAKVVFPSPNQQAYWTHVGKYLQTHGGGRGGIKAAADSWAAVSERDQEKAPTSPKKEKVCGKGKAKAKAMCKGVSSSKAKGKAKAKANTMTKKEKAKETKSDTEVDPKKGVTKTIQNKQKTKSNGNDVGNEESKWDTFKASA